jgi:predicted esterase
LKKIVEYPYQAFYSVSHEPTFQEREIWIVFHGYGQLAEYFIQKFLPFDNKSRLIVAPEGTNYTYLNGFKGRVGANWMTSHEREIAIENNRRFLNQLMDNLLANFAETPEIKVLGFSQGAATATRWASQWGQKLKTVILWAGGFAEDLDLENAKNQFSDTNFWMVLGERDELITDQSLQKQEELIKNLGKKVNKVTFLGGHELNTEVLKNIFNNHG